MTNKRIFYLLIVLIVLSGACRKKNEVKLDPTEMGSDKKMYDMAVSRIKRDPEKARLLFKEVMQLYPDSVYATRAKLGIADSYFFEKDAASLSMAAAEYQEFVNLFPYSPDAIYAKYQIGMCYFNQLRKSGRDQTNTFSAIRAFEQMIQQYPDTAEAEKAKAMIKKARQNLALHYFNIGYYDMILGAHRGALVRFKQVLDEYPEFSQNDRLFYFTGKTYMKMGDFDSALSFCQRVISSFPKSKFVRKAKRMQKKVEELKMRPKKTAPVPQPEKKSEEND